MPLRVLTMNIWLRSDPWEQRLALLRRGLADLAPDLVGLQEVVRVDDGDRLDQLARLREETGYHASTTFSSDAPKATGILRAEAPLRARTVPEPFFLALTGTMSAMFMAKHLSMAVLSGMALFVFLAIASMGAMLEGRVRAPRPCVAQGKRHLASAVTSRSIFRQPR